MRADVVAEDAPAVLEPVGSGQDIAHVGAQIAQSRDAVNADASRLDSTARPEPPLRLDVPADRDPARRDGVRFRQIRAVGGKLRAKYLERGLEGGVGGIILLDAIKPLRLLRQQML